MRYLFFVLLLMLGLGCVPAKPVEVYDVPSKITIPLVSATKSRLELIYNSNAHNPTWAELKQFAQIDNTDKALPNKTVFMCGEFAQMVQNSAENIYNIKCGIVYINLDGQIIGHACNVFDTIDKGKVFVDCTGVVGDNDTPQLLCTNRCGRNDCTNYDTVAFVRVGEKYGRLELQNVEAFDYDYFKNVSKKWDDYIVALDQYNAKVDKHNEAVNQLDTEISQYNTGIASKIYYQGTQQYQVAKMSELELSNKKSNLNAENDALKLESQRLDGVRNLLDACIYKTLAKVLGYEIYWSNGMTEIFGDVTTKSQFQPIMPAIPRR
jgi:hypothetical protein